MHSNVDDRVEEQAQGELLGAPSQVPRYQPSSAIVTTAGSSRHLLFHIAHLTGSGAFAVLPLASTLL